MKKKTNAMVGGIAFVLFILLIILLKTVDVAAVGPEGTSVGLSHLNVSFHEMFPLNMTFYKLTEMLGYLALLVAAAFAMMGLSQRLRSKQAGGADHEFYILAGLYVAMGILYVLFEKVIINYRPEILPGETGVEASFPSSHTMLACVVFGSAYTMLKIYMEKSTKRLILQIVLDVLIFLTVFGRLICGVHWFTDIVGGVLISIALVRMFNVFVIEDEG
ncbi:MAG: phosphatase PAP2 family protein [Lachnospiraceae bacterium]|nr:phosphatase PAP2 family protein [Lachnospiraceae bacterium]